MPPEKALGTVPEPSGLPEGQTNTDKEMEELFKQEPADKK